jgi:hypothetical protein
MKIIFPLVLFLVLLSVSANAFVMSCNSYKITGIISDGGGKLVGTTLSPNPPPQTGPNNVYKMYVSVGQPVIGLITGSKYKMCLGIFCTNIFDTPHYVSVSGTIKYQGAAGDAVADSEAKVFVTYGGAKYEGSTNTDSNGAFTAKVLVPEEIANSNFVLGVYAKGKVEAIYECNYDKSTGSCSKK